MSFGLRREGLLGEEDARPGSPTARGYGELAGAPGRVSGTTPFGGVQLTMRVDLGEVLPGCERRAAPAGGSGPGGLGVTNSIVTHLLRRTALAKPPQTCCPQHFRQNNGAGAGNAASRLQSLPLRALLSPSAASGPGNQPAQLLA